jgi:hypothetical protein
VIGYLNIDELPEKYFIDRWRPHEKKCEKEIDSKLPADIGRADNQFRFNILSRRCIELASEASRTSERYNYLAAEIKRIEKEIMLMQDGVTQGATRGANSDDRGRKDQQPQDWSEETESTTTTQNTQSNNKTGNRSPRPLLDHQQSKRKGRPPRIGRQKTLVEQLTTKQQITCSGCGSHDHNIATCKDIQRGIQTNKRKRSGTSQGNKSQKERANGIIKNLENKRKKDAGVEVRN